MKIIKVPQFDFDAITEQVRTEQIIHDGIIKNIESVPDDLNYVCLPIALLINTKGNNFTQNILNQIEQQCSQKKTYVCQHIQVKNLNFFDNKVYTPHCLLGDKYFVIPHYNPAINENDYVPFHERSHLFSFVGCSNTNRLRKQLFQLNNDNDILIRDTGNWHFEKPTADAQRYKERYKEILCQTKFALCPPGTGPSTIRLYEAMAAGCIPVVFNDIKVPSCIEKYLIRLKSVDEVSSIKTETYSNIVSDEIKNVYWNNLSNSNMYKLIL